MSEAQFANVSENGEIPTFQGSEKAKASDFANYFCSYAQLYHQKQMLVDHNRMAAYHSAIMGNTYVFKDKVCTELRFEILEGILQFLLSFSLLTSERCT